MDPVYKLLVQPSINNENEIDFTESLSSEICLEIFSYLNRSELIRTSMSNKACKILASDEALWKALSPYYFR